MAFQQAHHSTALQMSGTETAFAVTGSAPVVVVIARNVDSFQRPTQAVPTDGTVAGSRMYEILKRGLDIVGSGIGLVVLAPLFAVIAACIKFEDRGPVLHRRQIVGCGGASIDAYKFRTMIPDADAYLLSHPELMAEYVANVKLRRDPRVTRVGTFLRRTSLDELPQLVNVLRGEMSLVGPRMIHPSEEVRYGRLARTRRRVRPGITGLWQVSGRQELPYPQRVALDRYYLSRRSLWFDLRILGATAGALLHRNGAY
jgi:lipopolysaccharide/colanic/teichoic acid biosynthesis glycosyltransferase